MSNNSSRWINLLVVVKKIPNAIPFENVNIRIVASIIVLLNLYTVAFAQDFDADSIYYTPIKKVKSKSSEKGKSTEQIKRHYPTRDPQAPSSEFDGDSIYYTPIPLEQLPELEERRNPFQEDPADSAKRSRFVDYFFNLQVGTLVGCSDCITDKEVTFTASTVHGVTLGKKFRIGGGIGFDSYYGWKTMPLFGSASFDVLGTKNSSAIFVQVNYGWSLPWRNENELNYGTLDVDGGQMLYGMAGLRMKYHDMRISFTLGGKYQSVTSYFEVPTIYYDVYGLPYEGASSKTTIVETMRRLAFGVTIGWK